MSEKFITWKKFYSVDCEELDAQHHQILDIINDLYELMLNGKENPELKGFLDRLVQYTKSHFQREEELMKACGYPKLDEHMQLHQQMRQKTLDLRKNMSAVNAQNLLQFLKKWWINHICDTDKQYSTYIKPVRA